MLFQGITENIPSSIGYSIVVLCQGKLRGHDYYAFVAIDPEKYAYFTKHYRPGLSNLGQFGKLLMLDKGRVPPLSVIADMRTRHKIRRDVSDMQVRSAMALMGQMTGQGNSELLREAC